MHISVRKNQPSSTSSIWIRTKPRSNTGKRTLAATSYSKQSRYMYTWLGGNHMQCSWTCLDSGVETALHQKQVRTYGPVCYCPQIMHAMGCFSLYPGKTQNTKQGKTRSTPRNSVCWYVGYRNSHDLFLLCVTCWNALAWLTCNMQILNIMYFSWRSGSIWDTCSTIDSSSYSLLFIQA